MARYKRLKDRISPAEYRRVEAYVKKYCTPSEDRYEKREKRIRKLEEDIRLISAKLHI